ncbi:hypothetical protein E3N88_36034 [Mikania micrantha]|uniref:Uncharacterized protein n=1 Tax=Mikania micrantha TaxID=192012 RepID=A0A5N6M2L5_9ASTR|nr:hypothetical protein E3N88_36034 [Mikania micrantha]
MGPLFNTGPNEEQKPNRINDAESLCSILHILLLLPPTEYLWKQAPVFPVGARWAQPHLLSQHNWNFSNLQDAFTEGGVLHGEEKVFLFTRAERQVILFDGQLKQVFMPVVVVIVSPFPPSDKIIVQKGNGCEEVIDMEKINMAWVPCNLLGQRGFLPQISVISYVQREPATLEYIELGSRSHLYFPFFDNPYKVDERRHQNSFVDIVYPTEAGVINQKFNWECHVSEGLAKRLIDAGELPRDQKDAFKKFVREKVNEGKRANREAIQQLIEAAEELSRTEVEVAAAFEKMRFYKFYPVAVVYSAKVV